MNKIQSINPYTGEILKEFATLSTKEMEIIQSQAAQAFDTWKQTSISSRAKLIKKAAEELHKNKEHYARLISLEMGKVIRESRSEIEKCAWACEFYAEKAAEFLNPEKMNLPDGAQAEIIYQPLGAILAVMPWNFPFWQVFRFAAPTLMAGNVGLLKHASNVPQCALAIQKVFEKAGFPKGVFQTVLIDSDATLKLIESPTIRAVSLTGSEKAGAAVASAAGKQIKKTLLELGGSDPFIVFADADIEKAAKTAAKARMINFGQSCIAAKRFIVEEPVYDQFLSLFKKEIQSLKQGDPLDENSDYACMARPDLAQELYEQVTQSIAAGAEPVLSGKAPEKDSARFNPIILASIPESATAFSEELFGPVASVFRVKNQSEAIRIANSTEFGLGASIWTLDKDKAAKIASQVDSGAVFINSMVASNPWLPFGGVKKSGFGRELSKQGILEFVNTKTVYLG